MAEIARGDVRRVPGTGVFVARLTRDIPPIVFWYLRHIRSLHASTVIVNVVTALVPYVAAKDRENLLLIIQIHTQAALSNSRTQISRLCVRFRPDFSSEHAGRL